MHKAVTLLSSDKNVEKVNHVWHLYSIVQQLLPQLLMDVMRVL